MLNNTIITIFARLAVR